MRFVAGPFQSPGQKALEAGVSAEVGMDCRFAIELRPDDRIPAVADREPAARAQTEKELIPVRTAGRERTFHRTDVQTELTRIRKVAGVAGGEKPEHRAIPGVGDVVGAIARREDQLRTRAQAK